MFLENTKYLQLGLLDTVAHLLEPRRQHLEDSWAGEFYREITCWVTEALFAPLYADTPSCPNTPVNLLFGIGMLKSGYGWSDAELFEYLDFDLQVRYALGVRDLECEICDPRTIYNFRRRVARQYCYRLKPGSYVAQLEQLGPQLVQWLEAWSTDYCTHEAYCLLQYVFHEHFTVATPETLTVITVKPPTKLSAASLQALSDPEATYRTKNGQGYRGYGTNVTETCASENLVQLVTQLEVALSPADDETLFTSAVLELHARMLLAALYVDGGYNGLAATQTPTQAGVTLVPTTIRRRRPNPEQAGLADFTWETTVVEREEQPVAVPPQVTCLQEPTVSVCPGRASQRYQAEFAAADCTQCPLQDCCPTQPRQRWLGQVLRVTLRQVAVAQARQRCAAVRQGGPPYLRPAVAVTVRSLKHLFGDERDQPTSAAFSVTGRRNGKKPSSIARHSVQLCQWGYFCNARVCRASP